MISDGIQAVKQNCIWQTELPLRLLDSAAGPGAVTEGILPAESQ